MLPIISGVTLAFIIVLGVSAVNIIMRFMTEDSMFNPTTENVTIPDYVGELFNDTLKARMESLNLIPGNITYATNDDVGAGRIISQLPEADEIMRVRPNPIPVNFVISQGRDTYLIEDLSVLEYRDVELMLRSRRINFETRYEPHDTVPARFIIYTEPGPGILLHAGETIYLYVSTGQEIQRIHMPDVRRMTETEARRVLTDAEIIIRRIDWEHSETVPAGQIIDQDIIPFREVPRRSTRVTLRISLGPRPAATSPPAEAAPPQE
jgi:beta-lactam-binding protein with PASTA domain